MSFTSRDFAETDLTAWTTAIRAGKTLTAQQAEWVARNDTAWATLEAAKAAGLADGTIPAKPVLSRKDRMSGTHPLTLAYKAATAEIGAAFEAATTDILDEIAAAN